MNTTTSHSWLLAAALLSFGCTKSTTAPPTQGPDLAEPEASAEAGAIAGETDEDCSDTYEVKGEVAEGKITETIDQQNINDSPFACTLKGKEQRVVFSFNSTSLDPSTECNYNLSYKYKGTGQPFSESQTLSCKESDLQFGVTATPIASNQKCKGLEPIILDPQIQLRTNNCGQTGGE